VDLATAATELYRLLPAEFVAARDAQAAEARVAGDRPLAVAIKALRRPTTSAWMANWLARARSDELGRLLTLGAAMRSAQDHLRGDELRQLSLQRHQVIAALASEARRAAAEAGLPVGEQAASELVATLNAALADDVAAEAVRSGHLAVALQHTGFGARDAGSAPIPTAPMPTAPTPTRPTRPGPDAAQPDRQADAERRAHAERQAEAERRRHLEAATGALRQAESTAAGADRHVGEATRLAADADERLVRLRAEVAELEQQLVAAQAEQAAATEALSRAEAERTSARRTASEAAEAVVAAGAEVTRWQ
jgi:hypothetical protein